MYFRAMCSTGFLYNYRPISKFVYCYILLLQQRASVRVCMHGVAVTVSLHDHQRIDSILTIISLHKHSIIYPSQSTVTVPNHCIYHIFTVLLCYMWAVVTVIEVTFTKKTLCSHCVKSSTLIIKIVMSVIAIIMYICHAYYVNTIYWIWIRN